MACSDGEINISSFALAKSEYYLSILRGTIQISVVLIKRSSFYDKKFPFFLPSYFSKIGYNEEECNC